MAIEVGSPAEEDPDAWPRASVEEADPLTLVRMLSHHVPELLGPEETLDLLRGADRLTAWAASIQARLLAHVHQNCDRLADAWPGQNHHVGFMLATTEIAPLLTISETAASRLLAEALTLTEQLPTTLNALETGHLNRAQAAVIIQQVDTLPPDAVQSFETTILARAPGSTPPKLAQKCRRLRERLHPETITTRKTKAAADRYVYLEPDTDGMAWLNAYLPAEQATGIYQRLTDNARTLQGPTEPRTLAQLRTDTYTDLLTACTNSCSCSHKNSGSGDSTSDGNSGSPSSGSGSTSTSTSTSHENSPTNSRRADSSSRGGCCQGRCSGIHARVFITVPALTLLGHSNEPGELDGYGPIDADTARKLTAHAPSFTRILTHPETGTVLSIGRTRYAVPQDLKNWLRVRDKTCRHPGCNRTATNSEIDHTIPWSAGGTTSHANLAHLCKRHHKLKTNGYWHYTQPQPGTISATSPTGKTYTTEPDPPSMPDPPKTEPPRNEPPPF